ncbi:MAG: O-antigen ligase family protein, partial [Patescibacteria group bacterium]
MKIFSFQNILLALAFIVLVLIAIFIQPTYIVGLLVLIFCVWLLSRSLIWGIYLMVFFFPFISLQINFGFGVNLPIVDILALGVFVGWIFRMLFDKSMRPAKFPGLIYFLGFFLVGALSIINVSDFGESGLWLVSLKYLLRPIVFFYLMFVVLPFNIIKKEKQVINILGIFYSLGILISLMGLWSAFFMRSIGSVIPRAIPFEIFGILPLGVNHNLIAETLIVIIPLAWILIKKAKDFSIKFWLSIGGLVMALTTFLTFSRAGWIVLFIEIMAIIYYEYLRTKKFKKLNKSNLVFVISLFLIILIFLGFFMYTLLTSPITASSNENRMEMIRIVQEVNSKHPLIGQGVGTFQRIVSYDYVYMLSFGSTIDAHGFVQKIIAETGFLGLLAFASIIIYIFKTIYSAYKKDKTNYVLFGLLIAVLGAFVFQLFNTSYYISKLWLIVGVALVAV